MSKQSDAKQAQGYRTTPATCSKCANYQSEMVEMKERGWPKDRVWYVEKNIRCRVGGFAIKKTATCNLHVRKEGGAA